MSKTKLSAAVSARGMQNKKSRDSFDLNWLKVKVTANMPNFKYVVVELSSINEYSILVSNVKFVLVQVTRVTQVMNMQQESAWKHGN